jgi:hypothetical protein
MLEEIETEVLGVVFAAHPTDSSNNKTISNFMIFLLNLGIF